MLRERVSKNIKKIISITLVAVMFFSNFSWGVPVIKYLRVPSAKETQEDIKNTFIKAIQTQEAMQGKINDTTTRHGFIKDAPQLAWRITSSNFEDIPEVIRRHIGETDKTKYSREYLEANIGSVLGLQMNGDKPDFYIIGKDTFDKKYKMVSVGGEQTKPANKDAYLVFDESKKQHYMVNVDESGNPLSYIPIASKDTFAKVIQTPNSHFSSEKGKQLCEEFVKYIDEKNVDGSIKIIRNLAKMLFEGEYKGTDDISMEESIREFVKTGFRGGKVIIELPDLGHLWITEEKTYSSNSIGPTGSNIKISLFAGIESGHSNELFDSDYHRRLSLPIKEVERRWLEITKGEKTLTIPRNAAPEVVNNSLSKSEIPRVTPISHTDLQERGKGRRSLLSSL